MGFFFNETKKEPKAAPKRPTKHRDIPIASLNELGCSVCPRDKDRGGGLKMEPQGAGGAFVYVLSAAPSMKDGDTGRYFSDKAGKTIERMMPRDADRYTRFGATIQCATDSPPSQHETECCRGRVVRDIEETRPIVILGVGDAPIAWATGLPAYAPTFRGKLITVKVGSHVCWYFPVNYPNFVNKESKYGPSEQEVALRHDIARLFQMVERDELPELDYQAGPYDTGIEIITGQEPGDFQKLERSLEKLARERYNGVDIETDGLRVYRPESKIWTAAVGTFEHTVAFPLDHPEGWGSEVQQRRVWSLFVDYLMNSGTKECHNLAFELEWFTHKIDPRISRLTTWDDTMSMSHTLDERPGTKSLDIQTIQHFGFSLKSQSNIDTKRIIEYPLRKVLRYNGMDSKWTNKAARRLRPLIQANPKFVYSHERKLRLASTLVLTEAQGMPVNVSYAETMEAKLEEEQKKTVAKLMRCPEIVRYTEKYGTFSPTTPDHVLTLLDKVCGRSEVFRKTKDGIKTTTEEEALLEIPASEVPSVPLILEHRGAEKLLSTYIRPLTTRRIINYDDMIRSKYSSMTAVTHRLAGEDPNPQNWPKRKHREVRGVVQARDIQRWKKRIKRWLLACDYGQIEFRVAGMASEDQNLVKYCWTGYDVHAYWAQRMIDEYPEIKDWIVQEFKVDWDEKGFKLLRQESKNKWVFPSIFGAAVKSRGVNCHLPPEIAEALDREFWDEFPDVRKWQKRLLARYEKQLYVETLGGLRRYGPMTSNEIINMPIQGTACEIVTEAMSALSERALIEDNMNIHPIFNGHDDLTFHTEDDILEPSIDVIVEEMCKHRFDYINVPLVVEVSIGDKWSDLKEVGIYRSDKIFNLENVYE